MARWSACTSWTKPPPPHTHPGQQAARPRVQRPSEATPCAAALLPGSASRCLVSFTYKKAPLLKTAPDKGSDGCGLRPEPETPIAPSNTARPVCCAINNGAGSESHLHGERKATFLTNGQGSEDAPGEEQPVAHTGPTGAAPSCSVLTLRPPVSPAGRAQEAMMGTASTGPAGRNRAAGWEAHTRGQTRASPLITAGRASFSPAPSWSARSKLGKAHPD